MESYYNRNYYNNKGINMNFRNKEYYQNLKPLIYSKVFEPEKFFYEYEIKCNDLQDFLLKCRNLISNKNNRYKIMRYWVNAHYLIKNFNLNDEDKEKIKSNFLTFKNYYENVDERLKDTVYDVKNILK